MGGKRECNEENGIRSKKLIERTIMLRNRKQGEKNVHLLPDQWHQAEFSLPYLN